MAYLDRWKTIFPEVVGSEARPKEPIDNSLAFNTDGFPQFIANDPVGFALQNAFLMQLFSNDARLGEMIDSLDDELDEHKEDTNAHANGISGNAASATKIKTARTIDGVSFDGSAAIIHYGTCSTAAATVAKTVECTGFALTTGSRIVVKFTVTNTAANPTLNVNSTGAKAIQYRGAAISAGNLAANRIYEFIYDGTNYQLVGDIDTNTVYTHPTTSGNKHIPSGGSSGQILRWSADGTAAWGADNNTTYSANDGVGLSGTTFYNSGVRSIATGSSNGTISVNTNGEAANVAVKGLSSAAYEDWDDAVHTSGSQTVSGTKTFTADVSVLNINPKHIAQMSTAVVTGNPSSAVTAGFIARDKNGANCGGCEVTIDTSKTRYTGCYVRNYANNHYIGIYCHSADTKYSVYPTVSKAISCGKSDKLWTTVYAQTATINTSDERAKDMIESIPDEVLDAWGNISLVRYKLKDSVAEKGSDKARYHTGVVAQNVYKAFSDAKLDPAKYGFYCHDEWEHQDAVYDSDGNETMEEVMAGDLFSIRYEEALCIEAAYQRRRADRLEERIVALEASIMRVNANEEATEVI